MDAVLCNSQDQVELLVSKGAEVNSKDNEVGLQAWTTALVAFD